MHKIQEECSCKVWSPGQPIISARKLTRIASPGASSLHMGPDSVLSKPFACWCVRMLGHCLWIFFTNFGDNIAITISMGASIVSWIFLSPLKIWHCPKYVRWLFFNDLLHSLMLWQTVNFLSYPLMKLRHRKVFEFEPVYILILFRRTPAAQNCESHRSCLLTCSRPCAHRAWLQ